MRRFVSALAALGLLFGCRLTPANLVIDSELQHVDRFWILRGKFEVLRDLGPSGHSMLYYPGDGGASGYRNEASFNAPVTPGRTYTFSAFVDGTGRQGTPPFVILQAVDGLWTGRSIYQDGKGRITTTFTIPSDSATTLIRGSFNPENGMYPVGRGAAFSEAQLEEGTIAHDYAPSVETPEPPPQGGNLVVDSEIAHPDSFWELTGKMRVAAIRGPLGHAALVYDGDGGRSGFDNSATFYARVYPGLTYTFSVYIDASAHRGTPPFVFLNAIDGTWAGTQMEQAGRGRVIATFTIPKSTGTTWLRGLINTENGTYRSGSALVVSEPLLEARTSMGPYQPDAGAAAVTLPPGGNLVIDAGLMHPDGAWRLSGRMHVVRGAKFGGAAIAYDGDGHPSDFHNAATFFARVSPGRTYTFSAFIDGSHHAGMPPYVFLHAVNGDWSGAQLDQPGKGRVFLTFAIPAESHTTCISGTINPQNGTYESGASLIFSEPQVAEGPAITRYQPTSSGPPCD